MTSVKNLKQLSFLVYGLGTTGKSVINFFKKNKITNFKVWDDYNKNFYKNKRPSNLNNALDKVNFIILSPGVSLLNNKNKKHLIKNKKKIITDLDLIFLIKNFLKSIVVTGTNGKSTTCEILKHILKKNGFKALLGGNIGTPILNLKLKKNNFLIIEASSFQLAHSKFISPDYALLLNITNDHLDWHGNMKNYIESKFKVFKNQKKNQYSLLNKKLKSNFKKGNFEGKLILPSIKNYKKIKHKFQNSYLKSNINDENMSYVFTLSKLLKIKEKLFLKSLKSFRGLSHRYEIFFKRKNCVFINDSKATSFEATKFALQSSKNIFWILGGLPKKNDKIILNNLKQNIVKSYIIGNHVSYFKKQIHNKIKYSITKNLKNSLIEIFKDIKIFNKDNNSVLLSPSAASYDQYLNFEKRGDEFKNLTRYYARKHI